MKMMMMMMKRAGFQWSSSIHTLYIHINAIHKYFFATRAHHVRFSFIMRERASEIALVLISGWMEKGREIREREENAVIKGFELCFSGGNQNTG
jgi:hypothetical protein